MLEARRREKAQTVSVTDDSTHTTHTDARIVAQRPLMAVTSTDRRNTIILTRIDGVFADEKKVQACRVYGGTEDGAMGPLAKG